MRTNENGSLKGGHFSPILIPFLVGLSVAMEGSWHDFHLDYPEGVKMESLLEPWQQVLRNEGTLCRVSTQQIDEYISIARRRAENEGDSFFTITLPKFCSDLERSLSLEQATEDLWVGWTKIQSATHQRKLPKFLGEFLTRIFSTADGRLLEQPDIDCIHAIRQVTLAFGKILRPCSDARVEKAIVSYLECEQEIRRFDSQLTSAKTEIFNKMSTLLFGDAFQKVDEDVYYGRIIPRHGPGRTADRLYSNGKFHQKEWTARLEEVFPMREFLIPSERFSDHLEAIPLLEPGAERPVKVITVPKTLKTPRIIAEEPTCMMYVQQGLWAKLQEYLESDSRHNHVRGMLGFADQGPNQAMAQRGSRDGSLATLDLSEASDRVSNQLVLAMTRSFPNLSKGLQASRSRKADVRGHGVMRLAKFASMGSATCFPIEACVFLVCIMLGIQDSLNRPLTHKDLKGLRGSVRVYGDDIVIPAEYARVCRESLEAHGFKVNLNKSFWTGKFRESCGKEYYDGTDVSISRFRRDLPTGKRHVQEILSLVSTRNQFYLAGRWQVAKWIDDIVEPILGFYPQVHESSPIVGRVTIFGVQVDKWCDELHRPLVKGWKVRAKSPESILDDHAALLKCFLMNYVDEDLHPFENYEWKKFLTPINVKEHLIRAGRPLAVNIKLGYGSPF